MSVRLGEITRWMFRVVARKRRARALHPTGVCLRGRGSVDDVGLGLADRSELEVIVRLSRGAGLPLWLPDFNGCAIRFIDAHGADRHQDLLLTSAGKSPVLRNVLMPVRSFGRCGYSSVLPYRDANQRVVLFRCDPVPVDVVGDTATVLPITIRLRVASWFGAWRAAATVTLTEAVPDDLRVRFDPWNTGAALIPSGFVNRLRAAAYQGSREGVRADERVHERQGMWAS